MNNYIDDFIGNGIIQSCSSVNDGLAYPPQELARINNYIPLV